MIDQKLISLCIKNDLNAKIEFFKYYHGTFSYMSLRYAKDNQQSETALFEAFDYLFQNLELFNSEKELSFDEFTKTHFIYGLVNYIRSIRNEYYIASTIFPQQTPPQDKSYNLFIESKLLNSKNIKKEDILYALHKLVPTQRLVFNLHVIDLVNIARISLLLESNESVVTSNLEKARFNFKHHIQNSLKTNYYNE